MTDVPASPGVLKWARRFRGLSEAEAAARLGITSEHLEALELGTRKPSIMMFEKLAAQYRLPQATLFRRSAPPEPPKPVDYRTLGGAAHRESFEFSVALSNVRTLLSQFERISEDDDEFTPPALPSYDFRGDPGELGERERQRLGTGHHEQMKLHDAKDAFRHWRRLIEAQGVSVFLQKFPMRDCRGFTIYESQTAPCIVINKNEEYDNARIFTLLHEYAHLLIRKPGISDENPTNDVEAFCNRFAAGFLIPMGALRYLLPYWPNEPVDWPRSQVQVWAKRLKVSQQALALRLEHLGLAPQGFFAMFAGSIVPKKPRKNQQGSYIRTRISEVGTNFAGTVLGALDRQAITKAAAVEALGMSADYFPRVRAAVAGRRSLVDADV